MKNIIFKIILACAALCATSCLMNIKPYFATEDVTLDMKVLRVGAGFCHVNVEVKAFDGLSDEAWFFLGICPEEEYSKFKSDVEFMDWAVKGAKTEYDEWKKKYGNDFMVADFASHSLKYGNTETFFNYLEADTDYRVFCFVMNPETEKPVGDLYKEKIHTEYFSKLDVCFDYRIKDHWDYIYPKDRTSGKLISDVPWVAMTADSLDVRRSGVEAPDEYFVAKYDEQIADKSLRILYGMYAYNNDGIGDMGNAVCFEEGHTYYTSIATFDGWLADYAYYKFTWTGPGMEILLTEEDDCYGDW